MAGVSPIRMVGGRLLQAVPLLFGVALVNFVIIRLAPGDPVTTMLGEGAIAADQAEAMRQSLGLDLPIHEQFIRYIAALLQGDFGISYTYRQPVMEIIGSRIPATLLLMGSAYILATVVGLGAGILASLRRGSFADRLLMTLSVIGYSVPTYWLGFLALSWFSVDLGWLPISGMSSARFSGNEFERLLDLLRHMVLPVSILSLFYIGMIARLMRTSMLNAMSSDYVLTGRAMGFSRRRVVLCHAVPNAITPLVTILGLQIGQILSGAVLTESVFGWPGLGTMTVQAVAQRDYPLLLGLFLLTSVMVIIANVITDLVYLAINPRLRTNG